jgi:hypothetical protein
MAINRKIPQLPPADVPIIDRESGRMNATWYRYFQALTAVLIEMWLAL